MKKKGIKCNTCGEELFSLHRHDFKCCHCYFHKKNKKKYVAVDGGDDYLRIIGNEGDFTIIERDSSLVTKPKIKYKESDLKELEKFLKGHGYKEVKSKKKSKKK